MALCFDVEKAYDMIWKEGLLIKLGKMGICERLHRWIQDFLFGRSIRVKIGESPLRNSFVANGTL